MTDFFEDIYPFICMILIGLAIFTFAFVEPLEFE
jgi:hypothetical protein